MRLNTSIPTLFALSSLFSSGSSLPFFARRSNWLEPLVRRATYSVVPVDGGPAAATGANGLGGQTIIETVTAAPATKTIIDTPPVTTDYVLSTKTVQGPETAQTVIVTLSPSPETVTKTSYSVIDVNSPPVTIVVPAPAPSLSTSSTTVSPTSSTASVEATSSSASSFEPTSSVSATPTASSLAPSTASSVAYSATFVTYTSISSTTSSSATHSYDNGQWHTFYPPWNATATGAPVKGRSVEKKGPLLRGLKKALASL